MAPAASEATGRLLIGCGLVIAGGAVLSLGAFCVRLSGDMSPWAYIFWRSVALVVVLGGLGAVRAERDPFRQVAELGPFGWAGAICITGAAATFLTALAVSTLAEVFFLCSLAPLLAAVLAYPVLGERIGVITLAAVALALVGLFLVAGGAVPTGGSLTGKVLAIASAFCFAGYTLSTRGALAKDLDGMLIAFGLLSLVVGVVGVAATGAKLAPDPASVALAAIHGGLVLAAGLWLLGRGSRHVGAVTLTMLAQTETVLAPLWGFLFFRETPAAIALVGGCIILAAVVLQAVGQAAGEGGRSSRQAL